MLMIESKSSQVKAVTKGWRCDLLYGATMCWFAGLVDGNMFLSYNCVRCDGTVVSADLCVQKLLARAIIRIKARTIKSKYRLPGVAQ